MFNTRCSRKGRGHGDVEGGENHEGGDVQGDDGLQVLTVLQVVGGLVDDVHQDGGEVGHHDDVQKLPAEGDRDSNGFSGSSGEIVLASPPLSDDVLLHWGRRDLHNSHGQKSRQQTLSEIFLFPEDRKSV